MTLGGELRKRSRARSSGSALAAQSDQSTCLRDARLFYSVERSTILCFVVRVRSSRRSAPLTSVWPGAAGREKNGCGRRRSEQVKGVSTRVSVDADGRLACNAEC
jgi:hypothetical protein